MLSQRDFRGAFDGIVLETGWSWPYSNGEPSPVFRWKVSLICVSITTVTFAGRAINPDVAVHGFGGQCVVTVSKADWLYREIAALVK